jgi:hypothetical protein
VGPDPLELDDDECWLRVKADLDASVFVHGITIVGGFAILVIAEVFREGTRLHEDQSLTI